MHTAEAGMTADKDAALAELAEATSQVTFHYCTERGV